MQSVGLVDPGRSRHLLVAVDKRRACCPSSGVRSPAAQKSPSFPWGASKLTCRHSRLVWGCGPAFRGGRWAGRCAGRGCTSAPSPRPPSTTSWPSTGRASAATCGATWPPGPCPPPCARPTVVAGRRRRRASPGWPACWRRPRTPSAAALPSPSSASPAVPWPQPSADVPRPTPLSPPDLYSIRGAGALAASLLCHRVLLSGIHRLLHATKNPALISKRSCELQHVTWLGCIQHFV